MARSVHTKTEKKKLIAEVRRLNKPDKNGKRGLSIVKACGKVKLPVPTFYFWVNNV